MSVRDDTLAPTYVPMLVDACMYLGYLRPNCRAGGSCDAVIVGS